MRDIVIDVVKLGKQYHLGELLRARRQGESLTYAMAQTVRHPVATWRQWRTADDDSILWALRDVSFQVEQGEILGIIGHNGAGKSTLLKILSRITDPTEGHVRLRGRVGSLLEVGTGFQGMLTGRENVYLNGAILGMKSFEIDRKFDEIVDFAGVEKFIDTPVRHYSSGMYLRLAFAVAAHLEPEILLVDEVLAVGDATFQRKCLGKMGDVANEGRTVLFVSHNMGAIQELCGRAILLNAGQIDMDGAVHDVVQRHLKLSDSSQQDINVLDLTAVERAPQVISDDVQFTYFYLADENNKPTNTIPFGGDLRFCMLVNSKINHDELTVGITIETLQNTRVMSIDSQDAGIFYSVSASKPLEITVTVPDVRLSPGAYRIKALAIRYQVGAPLDRILNPLTFEILPIKVHNGLPNPNDWGIVSMPANWTTNTED